MYCSLQNGAYMYRRDLMAIFTMCLRLRPSVLNVCGHFFPTTADLLFDHFMKLRALLKLWNDFYHNEVKSFVCFFSFSWVTHAKHYTRVSFCLSPDSKEYHVWWCETRAYYFNNSLGHVIILSSICVVFYECAALDMHPLHVSHPSVVVSTLAGWHLMFLISLIN